MICRDIFCGVVPVGSAASSVARGNGTDGGRDCPSGGYGYAAVLRPGPTLEMRRVVLLRHGSTQANERGLYCRAARICPWSPAGREELRRLRQTGGYPDSNGFRLVTSGLRRAAETMEILFGPGEYFVVPGLQEMDFGDFELRGYEELRKDSAYCLWCSGDNRQNRAPNGESGEDMRRRVLGGVPGPCCPPGDFLAVLHGGPIAAIMEELFPEQGWTRYQWQPGNGRGYELAIDETGKAWYRRIPEGKRHEWEDK